jgi:cellulose biosynthesis protein BcsQ
LPQQQHNNAISVGFFSGKGGAGKTSAALGICKLLAEMEFKVLMVDYDLATSGASYFFIDELSEKQNVGIAQIIESYEFKENTDIKSISKSISEKSLYKTRECFDFIPSRCNLGEAANSNINILSPEFYKKILDGIVDIASKKNYDVLVIDNHAGYSSLSKAAASIVQNPVIVAEPDIISRDAVDNFLSLVGSEMAGRKRSLINKLEINEPGDYRAKLEVFRQANMLPPLPFDFSVRSAFGERKIPVDLDVPSPFLIVLFGVIKELFPEHQEKIEHYENQKITEIFGEYQESIQNKLEERSSINSEILKFRLIDTKKDSAKQKLTGRFYIFIGTIVLSIICILAFSLFSQWVNTLLSVQIRTGIQIGLIGVMVLATVMFIISLMLHGRSMSKFARLAEQYSEKEVLLNQRLEEMNIEIDRYRNLIAARSIEFRIDPPETAGNNI